MLAYMDLAKCLDKIQMIEAFRVTFPYLRKVWEDDAFDSYFEGHEAGSRHAWSKAGREGEPPAYKADEDERVEGVDQAIDEDVRRVVGKVAQMDTPIAEALDKLEWEMVDEGFTVWPAFCGFCAEEMGVEALNLLAVLGPIRERAEKLIELAERLEVEPGPEEIEEYRGILLTAWQRDVEKG
jgi:hypothetical protein